MQLSELEGRVCRLETRLGILEALVHPNLKTVKAKDSPMPEHENEIPQSVGQEPRVVPHPIIPPPLQAMAEVVNQPAAPPAVPTSLGRKAELLHYPRATKPAPVAQGELEKTIGLKWAGWLGAIVFIIGASLGVKYAYDQGWLHHLIPDWVWLTLIVSAGFALIGVGEWVYRRINHLSAAGLFAAGVATLFIASYAGHAYYELYSQSVAFACMAISALVGSAVALRGKMVSIGVISLLGANVAPMLLGDRNAPVLSFYVYLLATQVLALSLAFHGKAGKWWTLRGLSLASISLWMAAMIPLHRREIFTLGFTLVYAAVYQIELIITNFLKDTSNASRRGEAAGLAFSMFTTAALTAGMIWLHYHNTDVARTAWVLGIAGVCALLAVAMPSFNRPAITDMATGFALQAIALTVVAAPVYTSGMNVEIGWAVLALGLALIGAMGNKDLSRATSIVTWALAVGHLIIRAGSERDHAIFTTINGIDLHTNALMAMGLALIGQFIAGMATARDKNSRYAPAAAGASWVATIMWCAVALFELPMGTATFVILAYAWCLLAVTRMLPDNVGETQGAILLMGSAVKWLFFDALGPVFSSSAVTMPVMFNSMTLSAAVLIASAVAFIAFIPSIAHDQKSIRDIRVSLNLAIAIIALIDLSIELSHWFDASGAAIGLNDPRLAKQVALSIFWACFAVASVAFGFAFREAPLRYFGLLLLAGTLLKVVTVDLAGVSQGYRILSFIGVGLLMLGTSVLYGRVLLPLPSGEGRGEGTLASK